MNLSDITYVNAAQKQENENVTLCNSIYIFKPDHKTAVIDITKSKCSVEGPQSGLVDQPHFIQNAVNNSISVLAKVSGWDGTTFGPGDLVLKLELKLEDGTPIDWKTNIVLRHAYWIYPAFPVWDVASPGSEFSLQLREGLNTTPITGATWAITSIPEEHASDIEIDQSSGVLTYKASEIPTNAYEIGISATKDDYLIKKDLWIA